MWTKKKRRSREERKKASRGEAAEKSLVGVVGVAAGVWKGCKEPGKLVWGRRCREIHATAAGAAASRPSTEYSGNGSSRDGRLVNEPSSDEEGEKNELGFGVGGLNLTGLDWVRDQDEWEAVVCLFGNGSSEGIAEEEYV